MNEDRFDRTNGGRGMGEDKFDRTNGGRGMSETDKGYYEELYTDLPKEVVDILMQTHPLMGKNEDEEATAYRSRRRTRPQREDVEEVREARMQQVSHEINEISKAPQQEGDPTRYVSRRARNAGISEDSYQAAAPAQKEDEYEDGIQYVSVVPARKKSRIVEEITLQTTAAPAGRRKKQREPQPFEDMGRDARDHRPRYESLDFEERAKQEHLDSLYDNDYDDDEGFSGKSKLAIILGVAAVIIIIVLIFRTVSLNSEMEEMQNQLTQSEEYKAKYEQVQLEKMQVEEELESLKNPTTETNGEDEGDAENNTADNTAAATTPASTTSSGYTEYTVQSGDTAWTIAEKQLGNGAEYQKILDANGLKESDPLKIGSKIKIPK